MVVIGILAMLAALLFPVAVQAKEEAKKSVCVSNLRQIFLATALYRSEANGDGVYGTTYEMGLPPSPRIDALPILTKLLCPEGNHPFDQTLGSGYYALFADPGRDGLKPTWEDYASTYQDAAIIYVDPFHNPANYSLIWGDHISRFCQGMSLGGTLVKRKAKGDWEQRLWWRP